MYLLSVVFTISLLWALSNYALLKQGREVGSAVPS